MYAISKICLCTLKNVEIFPVSIQCVDARAFEAQIDKNKNRRMTLDDLAIMDHHHKGKRNSQLDVGPEITLGCIEVILG